MVAQSYLRVSGDRIVDGSGRTVRLRGYCLGGWLNMENFITGYPASEMQQRRAMRQVMGDEAYEAFFDEFLDVFVSEADAAYLGDDLGTNACRIPVSYKHFESDDDPMVLKPEGLARLDRVVEQLAAHGIYSIIDMHALPGCQNHHWHSDNPTHWPMFWEQRSFQERGTCLWEVLTEHYKGNGWVAGMNLMNEPADEEGTRLLRWYAETERRVRAIDPDRMLFLDGNRYSTDFSMFTEPLPNTVYTAHDYVVVGIRPEGRYPATFEGQTYDKGSLEQQFLRRTEFMRSHGMPVWIGEFAPQYLGDPVRDEERYRLLADQLDIYRDYGASWAAWTYKDIGLQGVVYADPDSAWLRRLAGYLTKKTRLGADSWGGTDRDVRHIMGPIEQTVAAEAPDFDPYPWGVQKWSARLVRHILLSEALLPEYAECFRGVGPDEARALARSFAFENCRHRPGLEAVLRDGLAKDAAALSS